MSHVTYIIYFAYISHTYYIISMKALPFSNSPHTQEEKRSEDGPYHDAYTHRQGNSWKCKSCTIK